MIIKAKFIGKSSLGFVHGTTYNLNCAFYFNLVHNPSLKIEANGGSFPNYERLRCEYTKIDTFLSLWKILSIHLHDEVTTQLRQSYDSIVGKFHKNMRDNKIEMILA